MFLLMRCFNLGRTAARGIETQLVANWTLEFYNTLMNNIKNGDERMANMDSWEPSSWPNEAKGVGFMEAPRGALAHWITIKDQKTKIIKWWFHLPGMRHLVIQKDKDRLMKLL